MKEIPLSRGQVALVDDEDFEELSKFKWFAYWSEPSRTYYAVRNTPRGSGLTTQIRMHRQITGVGRGRPQIDHANHNGLDNRRQNLRVCSQTQNNHNLRKVRRRCTNRYKGVTLYAKTGRWQAKIREPRADGNSRCKHLGYFATENEAARAYNLAARALFGEFALLNELESDGALDLASQLAGSK